MPFPPTANTNWRQGNGKVYISVGYKAWREHAGLELNRQKPRKFEMPVRVALFLTPPTKQRLDLDNRIKPVLDLLVAHKVLTDDSTWHVRAISAELVESGPGCRVEITPI